MALRLQQILIGKALQFSREEEIDKGNRDIAMRFLTGPADPLIAALLRDWDW